MKRQRLLNSSPYGSYLSREEILNNGLIVSIRAKEGSPMAAPNVIAAMAKACFISDAVGVRLEKSENLSAVRRRSPKALII